MNKFGFILISCSIIFATAHAESTQASHAEGYDDAIKLLRGMHSETNWNATISALSGQIAQGHPEVAMALQQFFTKSMSYKVMEPQLADVYAKNYTKAEMQDLLTFYNTPTGKKSLEVAPKIASESVALGEQVMISHKAELQKIIRESVEKSKPIKK